MSFEQKISFTGIIKEKIPELQLGIIEIQDFKVSKNSENVHKAYHDLFSNIENKFADGTICYCNQKLCYFQRIAGAISKIL